MHYAVIATAARVGVLLSAALILYFTLTPSPRGPALTADYVAHFLLFLPLGAAAALWFATSGAARRSPRRALMMLVLALWIFAAFTELAQGPITGRDPALRDWFADMAGALTGLFGGSALARWVLRR